MLLNKFFRKVHFQTILVLVIYFLFSKTVFLHAVFSQNLFISYLGPLAFGVLSSFIFFYFFSHEDFFHFIKDIEKVEVKKEKKYVRRFKHWGRLTTCLIAGTVGGPILSALVVRFLLRKNKYRYLILILNSIFSTVWITSFARGGFRLIL